MFSWLRDRAMRHKIMKETVATSLASQFRMLRISRGMTQEEFAKFLGMTQSQVSLYETTDGMRRATLRTLFDIASKCDVAFVCRYTGWRQWLQEYYTILPADSFDKDELTKMLKHEETKNKAKENHNG